jgi:ectoine hydroxylase-related dioxygenase (phytanoyl-CoA dioxygenase family)
MDLISLAEMAQFRDVGLFLTDVVFTPDELDPMARDMDRVYAEELRRAEASGDADAVEQARGRRSFGRFHTLSPVAATFVKKPIYLEACRRLVGADADLYYNQATTKMPEGYGKVFDWHQDSGYTTTEPLEYITCWTAISDSDLENGCIWVLPESHKHGVLDHAQEPEDPERYGGNNAQAVDDKGAGPVEMRAGQVAIFSSLLLHRSGPNTSKDRPRRGLVPQYHVPNAILVRDGKPWGDRVPVLRDGEPV